MKGLPTPGTQLEQTLQKALKKLTAIEIKMIALDEKLDKVGPTQLEYTGIA